MDAVKFLKEAINFCKNQPNCDACELLNEKMMFTCALNISEDSMSAKDPEKLVEVIERWSANNSVKTRQSVFLEQYQDAETDEHGVIDIAPCAIEKSRFRKNSECICNTPEKSCEKCKKMYWLG